jgi:hypothetical protein
MCGPWMGLDNVTTTSTELASPENRNKALRWRSSASYCALVALNAVMSSIPASIQGRQATSALQVARYFNIVIQDVWRLNNTRPRFSTGSQRQWQNCNSNI